MVDPDEILDPEFISLEDLADPYEEESYLGDYDSGLLELDFHD